MLPCCVQIPPPYRSQVPSRGALLHIACRSQGNSELVDDLIYHGADLDYQDVLGDTPLHTAVQFSDSETVIVLLSYTSYTINRQNNKGDTALHKAVELNKLEFVELLLEHPMVNTSIRNSIKQTPLHVAILQDHLDTIDVLLKTPHIDLDILKDSDGKTCRQRMLSRYPRITKLPPFDYLKSKTTLKNILFSSIYSGDTAVFQRISCYVRKHWLNEDDGYRTLLQYACYYGVDDVVKILLDLRVDVEGKGSGCADSPLVIALTEGHPHVVRVLLTKHEYLSFRFNEGRTILHEMFLSAKFQAHFASSKNTDNLKKTYEYKECLKCLLDLPREVFDINAVDEKHGNTGFHLVAQTRNQEMIMMMLDAGAYPGLRNRDNELPLKFIDLCTLEGFLDNCVLVERDGITRQMDFIFDGKILRIPESHHLDVFQPPDTCIKNPIISKMNLLIAINETPHLRKVLTHVVIKYFVMLKWHSFKTYYYLGLMFYSAFLIFLSSFVICTWYIFPVSIPVDEHLLVFLTTLWSVTFSLYGALVLEEFSQLYLAPRRYLKSCENWLLIFITSVTGRLLFHQTTDRLHSALEASSIILSWLELVVLMSKHPSISHDIGILKNASFTYFKYIAVCSILIFVFGLGLCIVFYNLDFESFSESCWSLMEELGIGRDLFYQIFIVCLVFSLVIVYLVLGISVVLNWSDIRVREGIREDVELQGVVYLVNFIWYVETITTNLFLFCDQIASIIERRIEVVRRRRTLSLSSVLQ